MGSMPSRQQQPAPAPSERAVSQPLTPQSLPDFSASSNPSAAFAMFCRTGRMPTDEEVKRLDDLATSALNKQKTSGEPKI